MDGHAAQPIPFAWAIHPARPPAPNGIRQNERRTGSRLGRGPVYSRPGRRDRLSPPLLSPGNKARSRPVSPASIRPHSAGEKAMSESKKTDDDRGVNRRKALECMTWAGTGVLWTISGGVPHSLGIIGEAKAQGAGGLTFLQISDSHTGFDRPANPNVNGTLEVAINKVKALPVKPSFMLHTGDITHLSKPAEFDNAERVISQS